MKSFIILALLGGSAFGQQPEIEVVSVKPSDPARTAMWNHFSPGLYNYAGYTLQSLIQDTYHVRDYQVLNAAGWLRSERWDIDLKTTAPANFQQRDKLFETILADRFQLRFHRETRMMPVYSLVVARGGPKLKAPQDDKPQGTRYGDMIVGTKYDIRQLASDLSGNLNIPVVDKTGLTGIYDIDLKWTPDPARKDFGDVHAPTDPPPLDPNRPEVFTAIKEQLGLELKAEKGPVEVIVIDQAERPSAN
jgi:uncharacterized protein (TIGR03435 family)